MADKEAKTVSPTDDIEMNVQIIENKDGSLNVGYAVFRAGTQDRINLRPAHVIGLLHCAATFVEMKSFPSLQAKVEEQKPKKK